MIVFGYCEKSLGAHGDYGDFTVIFNKVVSKYAKSSSAYTEIKLKNLNVGEYAKSILPYMENTPIYV
ncbi:MAG: hypothetical protein ACK55I_45470, partial [bacterium]